MSMYKNHFNKTKCLYFMKKIKKFLTNILKLEKNLAI